MKYLIVVLMCFCLSADACKPYFEIGAGYALQEPNHVLYEGERLDINFGGNPKAHIEVGCNYGTVEVAINHKSQWLTGWPLNDEPEYYLTQVLVKKRFWF